jgi:hypothetical protein
VMDVSDGGMGFLCLDMRIRWSDELLKDLDYTRGFEIEARF